MYRAEEFGQQSGDNEMQLKQQKNKGNVLSWSTPTKFNFFSALNDVLSFLKRSS